MADTDTFAWWNMLPPSVRTRLKIKHEVCGVSMEGTLYFNDVDKAIIDRIYKVEMKEAFKSLPTKDTPTQYALAYAESLKYHTIEEKVNIIAIGLLTIPISIDDLSIVIGILKKVKDK